MLRRVIILHCLVTLSNYCLATVNNDGPQSLPLSDTVDREVQEADGIDVRSLRDQPIYSPERIHFSSYGQASSSIHAVEVGLINTCGSYSPPRSLSPAYNQENFPSHHLEQGSLQIINTYPLPRSPLLAQNQATSPTNQPEEGLKHDYPNSGTQSGFDPRFIQDIPIYSPPCSPLLAYGQAPSSCYYLEDRLADPYNLDSPSTSPLPFLLHSQANAPSHHLEEGSVEISNTYPLLSSPLSAQNEATSSENHLEEGSISSYHNSSETNKRLLSSELLDSSVPKSRKRAENRKYSEEQMTVLLNEFEQDPYVDEDRKKSIAMQTGLSPKQVVTWFNHQRQREKRNRAEDEPLDSSAPKSRKRAETRKYSEEQMTALLNEFEQDPYVDEDRKNNISIQIGLSPTQVGSWFKHQRAREKRKGAEDDRFDSRVPNSSLGSYSKEIKNVLLKTFEVEASPNEAERAKIAEKTGLSPNQVTKWFNNQRWRVKIKSAAATAAAETNQLDSRVPNNHGIKFSKEQRVMLQEAFCIDPFPGQAAKEELIKKTGLTQRQIIDWFVRERKLKKKRKAAAAGDPEKLKAIAEKEACKREMKRDYMRRYRTNAKAKALAMSDNDQQSTLNSNFDNEAM